MSVMIALRRSAGSTSPWAVPRIFWYAPTLLFGPKVLPSKVSSTLLISTLVMRASAREPSRTSAITQVGAIALFIGSPRREIGHSPAARVGPLRRGEARSQCTARRSSPLLLLLGDVRQSRAVFARRRLTCPALLRRHR